MMILNDHSFENLTHLLSESLYQALYYFILVIQDEILSQSFSPDVNIHVELSILLPMYIKVKQRSRCLER